MSVCIETLIIDYSNYYLTFMYYQYFRKNYTNEWHTFKKLLKCMMYALHFLKPCMWFINKPAINVHSYALVYILGFYAFQSVFIATIYN